MSKRVKNGVDSQKPKRISLAEINKTRQECKNRFGSPLIYFRFLTTNKNYNFNHFGNDFRKKCEAYGDLEKLLCLLSGNGWVYWSGLRKEQLGGFETIHVESVNPSLISKEAGLLTDSKIFVFRFSKQQYRLLGFKRDGCNAVYILGFDFDYSAYSHGN